MDVVIYHNPDRGTSRNTLAMIRNAGIEPHVIDYLKTPPSRALLMQLTTRIGITPRDLLREKGTPYAELGLDDPSPSGEVLLDAVLDLLPQQQAGFSKEDGQPVVDPQGNRPRSA